MWTVDHAWASIIQSADISTSFTSDNQRMIQKARSWSKNSGGEVYAYLPRQADVSHLNTAKALPEFELGTVMSSKA